MANTSSFHAPPAHEIDACGVGFIASRHGRAEHGILQAGLHALVCVEHRGGVLADGVTGDGAGVMTDIPFELFGFAPHSVVVGSLFLMTPPEQRGLALEVLERSFSFMGLKVIRFRSVPHQLEVLGQQARDTVPELLHVFIERPPFCRTDASLNQLLYSARQALRTKMKEAGLAQKFFFASLSTSTIVYKALTTAEDLPRFYPDLVDPAFKTRFCVFHRRFSTNTVTTWDKAQPFRLIAHNGEINTIQANRSWSLSREQDLGLPPDELLTHGPISDSGHFNEMTEALKYRSSIPDLEDILAIMIPPAGERRRWYDFWSRAQEPWDGPAFIAYCDGETIGGRLDRNGFRPCRWALTDDHFYFASEAGVFDLDERKVLEKGTLQAGSGVMLRLDEGRPHFRDPSESRENAGATLDPRLIDLEESPPDAPHYLTKKRLFGLTREERDRMLEPMFEAGKEPIGSMGDTARVAVLSTERRSFFDYFYQTFAQVTNPPLDYLRERMVTDLSTHLGKRPNIFAPKELIPPTPALRAQTPVLRLGHMAWLRSLDGRSELGQIRVQELDTCFDRVAGARGMDEALTQLAHDAVARVKQGCTILVLSDRAASWHRPPLPSLLALRTVVRNLSRHGLRLEASVIVESGDARTTHQVAALISFGATAVCPALCLELARAGGGDDPSAADARELRAVQAYEGGLLRIMSKMGISVVRSYQSSKLFCSLGLGDELLRRFFPDNGAPTPIGGISLSHVAEDLLRHTRDLEHADDDDLPSTFLLKEHNQGSAGERHSMTSARSRIIHELVKERNEDAARQRYEALLADVESSSPIHPRHLLDLRPAEHPLPLEEVEPVGAITRRFGSGAMSYGAISAQAQRDIFLAMKELGGRSNSGEGGENPFYFLDGTTATTKQIASGRFGVTAEYLATGEEIEIKIAQGAKPGEGGQLMAVKVNADIARARFSRPGTDLISPPPLHDIYSIEDLKELIYELKQTYPDKRVCVKLVSGVHIGTIAAGVVKAGADIVQISGGDGGTGAATLTSMRHAGLPWELGLVAVHRELTERGLRDNVRLRVDGGITTGKDVVVATALGADEVGFGKLLLVAEGCIMARVCEKNTCPRGIATHDERFLAKYRGSKDDIVALLTQLAEDVRRHLARLGFRGLEELRGRASVLMPAAQHARRITERSLRLDALLREATTEPGQERSSPFRGGISPLNEAVATDALAALARGEAATLEYPVRSTDRAVLATLNGKLAMQTHRERMDKIAAGHATMPDTPLGIPDDALRIRFSGSAGQGFGVFLVRGLDVTLVGEANDSVCKGMSGGTVTIRPPEGVPFVATRSAIVGNCALYGATGGRLFISGAAGDRFAVRNSGATAVIDSVGMHACGYMTGGTVVILGATSHNLGSGMTGGVLYTRRENEPFMNREYICASPLQADDEARLLALLEEHHQRTGSQSSLAWMQSPARMVAEFRRFEPKGDALTRTLPVRAFNAAMGPQDVATQGVFRPVLGA